MEFLVILVVILIGVPVALYYLRQDRRNREIVMCGSCGNRMSFRRFKERGGCQQCGSDLFERTGQQT